MVTGGSGFLGANLVRSLLEKYPDWKITILDIHPPEPAIHSRITCYKQADVTSAESVRAAFAAYHPDIVVHSAGIVPAREQRYSRDSKQWERVKSVNYQGTVNVLDATMASGCRKFLYTSSCTTIIDDLHHDYYNMNEELPLGFATLHYGRSKALAEQYVLSPDHAAQGLKACALRPCTIIGPGDVAVISVIHDLIARSETCFVIGDGNNLYDFMYIDNAVDAHVLAIENLLTKGTAVGAFFISNQEPVYFWDLFLAIWAEFGHVPRFRVFLPLWLACVVAWILELLTFLTGAPPTINTGSVLDGVGTRYSDNSKARQVLGYYPKVRLAEAVKRSCDAYKNYLAGKEAKQTTIKKSD
jgi:sterol-4alpha-carboxylate 3-dehydrogenase (decarboxylating)